jgi:hypothetical protein
MNRFSIEYDQFRTDLSFVEIWEMLKIEKNEGKRSHITRHTVLGKWHEIKIKMFEAYYGR